MSIVTMVLGESGTGKTCSLHNMNPADTLLIQAVKKPLPFRSPNWKPINEGGNIIVSDKTNVIVNALQKTTRNIIVLDDMQYTMSNEFMRRVTDQEVGNSAFAKYNEIAKNAWDIVTAAMALPDNKRVYFLSHSATDELGKTKIKTIGKLLDEKIVLEGLVTIVLRTVVQNGNYFFSTRNNGNDTVKTPFGMFDEELIENDLKTIDETICNYYNLEN